MTTVHNKNKIKWKNKYLKDARDAEATLSASYLLIHGDLPPSQTF